MGISSSSNTVNSMLKNVNDVFNTYENICSSNGNEVNTTFTLNHCSLTGDIFRLNNYQAVSQSCMQSAETKSSIQSQVSQSMRQMANSIVQSVGMPSLALADSFIQTSVDVGNQIANNYISQCIGNATQSNLSFNCENSSISNTVVEIDSYQTLTQSCVSKYITDNNLASKLTSILDQSSSATQANTFGYFMLVFVLFIGIIAWAGISLSENPLVQWVIVGLVLFSIISAVIYTATARSSGRYPYTKAT